MSVLLSLERFPVCSLHLFLVLILASVFQKHWSVSKLMPRFGMQSAKECQTEKGPVSASSPSHPHGHPLALASTPSMLHSPVCSDLCLSILKDLLLNPCLGYLMRFAHYQCPAVFTTVSVLQNDHVAIFKVKKTGQEY